MGNILSAIQMIQERLHIALTVQGEYGITVPPAQYLSSKEAQCRDGVNNSLQKQSLIFFSYIARAIDVSAFQMVN